MQPTDLVEAIGVEAATKLVSAFGGGMQHIPSLHRLNVMVARNAAIVASLDAGQSIAQVARVYGISRDTVRRVQRMTLEARRKLHES